jgi:hypothetical protein
MLLCPRFLSSAKRAGGALGYPLGSNLAFDLWMLDVSVAVFSADILTEGPTTATER